MSYSDLSTRNHVCLCACHYICLHVDQFIPTLNGVQPTKWLSIHFGDNSVLVHDVKLCPKLAINVNRTSP